MDLKNQAMAEADEQVRRDLVTAEWFDLENGAEELENGEETTLQ